MTELTPEVRARLTALYEDGREVADGFHSRVRRPHWHPFVAADYERVERTLIPLRRPGRTFLEWGSATGIITIMADLLGFEAYGIEIDGELVALARDVAQRFDSNAQFAAGSFLPAGYRWKSETGDLRMGTLGEGVSGYQQLKKPLEDFDVVFGYPWGGEEPIMHDLMRSYGARGALLLMHGASDIEVYQAGKRVG